MSSRLSLRLWRNPFFLALVLLLVGAQVGAAQEIRPGARLTVPNEGEISALVLFVQFPTEPDAYGDWASDPATEWPHARGLDPARAIPAWGEDGRLLAPPGTPPEQFAPGSLSAFYHTMSHGRFRLTGYVYPEVLHPAHAVGWYHANRGDFPNGAVKLSHEILTSDALQTYFDANPDGLDLGALDTFTNGTTERTPDGIFDLIIMVHRDEVMPNLRLNRNGQPIGGTSLTSLGADLELRPSHPIDYRLPESDAFEAEPVTLGGLRVIDNVTSGSGVTVRAYSWKQAVRLITHEIGHRHFGLYHTCQSPTAATSDCIGIMGGASVTMSAPDRIKLGWAEVVNIDVEAFERHHLTLPDALTSGKVFRIRHREDSCGDLIVEARFWSNPWDHPPDAALGNDDGDDVDLFLPQEGLYLYKAPEPGSVLCGGRPNPASDEQRYASLENNGIIGRVVPFSAGPATEQRAFRVGGTYQVAYEPGDTFSPDQRPRFDAHVHPWLDPRLTLTSIQRRGDAFTAELWTDALIETPEAEQKAVYAFPNPVAGRTTIRYAVPPAATVRVDIFDSLGRLVTRLAEGPHQAGHHELAFDVSALRTGIYWCRVSTGDRVYTAALHVVQ